MCCVKCNRVVRGVGMAHFIAILDHEPACSCACRASRISQASGRPPGRLQRCSSCSRPTTQRWQRSLRAATPRLQAPAGAPLGRCCLLALRLRSLAVLRRRPPLHRPLLQSAPRNLVQLQRQQRQCQRRKCSRQLERPQTTRQQRGVRLRSRQRLQHQGEAPPCPSRQRLGHSSRRGRQLQ